MLIVTTMLGALYDNASIDVVAEGTIGVPIALA